LSWKALPIAYKCRIEMAVAEAVKAEGEAEEEENTTKTNMVVVAEEGVRVVETKRMMTLEADPVKQMAGVLIQT
jgi:hypothetical protein